MQAQDHPRYKKRIPCEFEDEMGHHLGMVLNVSERGLFVSSRVTPRVGSTVVLHLSPGSGPLSTDVAARVVWKRKVHRSVPNMGAGGIGLEIEGTSEDFDRLMQDLIPAMAKDSAPSASSTPLATDAPDGVCEEKPASSGTTMSSYRVRLTLLGSPQTRSVKVSAANDIDACAHALDSLGEGWRVVDVTPG